LKWLLLAALLAVPLLSLWARLRPRSRIGTAAAFVRDPRDGLRGMSRRQLIRGGLAFLLFAAVAGAVAALVFYSSTLRGWLSLDTPFVAALAGASATIAGLALLIGLYLLGAAMAGAGREADTS
jgi:hypothetical protein